MALRPEISGFDLARMRALFGCGDHAVADRAVEHARRFAGTDLAVEAHVRDIVLGTVAPDRVSFEKADFVNAVVSLAYFGQAHLETGSNVWKNGHLDLWSTLPEEPPADARWADAYRLLEWALVQRPLFGVAQDSDWTTYGYLSHDEVRRLLSYRDLLPDSRDQDFAGDFFDWLEEIDEAGLDYWFYAR